MKICQHKIFLIYRFSQIVCFRHPFNFQVNPRGEVPVLKHGDKVIVESSSILKYIDETLGT